jgi:hypothetical protein
MFIPDVLRAGVAAAFEVPPQTVYERRGPPVPSRVEEGRRLAWIASVLAVAASGATIFFGLRRRVLFRRLGGALLGGLGAILLFAALVSALPELGRNELLLVFFPLDFFLLSSNRAFVISYSTMRLVVLGGVAVLALAGVLLQPLWPYWLASMGILAAIRVAAGRRSYTKPS